MNRNEAMQFVDEQLRTRWPQWEPTKTEILDWLFWLGPYEKAQALHAVRSHAAENPGRRPIAAKVLSRLGPGRTRRRPEPTRPPLTPDAYIQCVQSGRSCKAGTFEPIHLTPLGHALAPQQVRDAARRIAEQWTRQLGGQWIVVTETPLATMTRRRREMQIREKA